MIGEILTGLCIIGIICTMLSILLFPLIILQMIHRFFKYTDPKKKEEEKKKGE